MLKISVTRATGNGAFRATQFTADKADRTLKFVKTERTAKHVAGF